MVGMEVTRIEDEPSIVRPYFLTLEELQLVGLFEGCNTYGDKR